MVENRCLHERNQSLVSGTVHTGLGLHSMTAQFWSCLQLRRSCTRACSQMARLCSAADSGLLYICSP